MPKFPAPRSAHPAGPEPARPPRATSGTRCRCGSRRSGRPWRPERTSSRPARWWVVTWPVTVPPWERHCPGCARPTRSCCGTTPDFEAAEALSVAWSEATLEYLHDLSCEDPLTGLASLAHVRTRLDEIYREAELTDVGVPAATPWSSSSCRSGPPRRRRRTTSPARCGWSGGRGAAGGVLRRPDDRPARPGPGRRLVRRGPPTSALGRRCCATSSATSTSAPPTCGSGSRGCRRRRLGAGCCSTTSPAELARRRSPAAGPPD